MKPLELAELEALDLKAPAGAFSTFDQEAIVPALQAIPENGVYMEIGVDKGKSLWLARQVVKPSVTVYGVDLSPDPKVEGTTFFRGDSARIARRWDGPDIDVLFIDGDHSYVGCKADIDAWAVFVKLGGHIFFHDCDEASPGVVRAVAEYADTHNVGFYQVFKRSDRNTSMAVIKL